MEANQRLAENAAVAHVQWAQGIVQEGRIPDTVAEVHLALLLGAVIRRLDTLNTRMDTIEELLKRKPAE